MRNSIRAFALLISFDLFRVFRIACGWWAFGHLWGQSMGWSTVFNVEDREFLYRYTTSLHWALSQLGVSSTQIEATNTTERIYSIFVAFVSLITFSTMVSSMTSMMGTWYKEKEEERKQFSSLQRYLRHNAIPPALSQRVTHFLQHAASERKAMVSDSHVELLDLLSKPLRGELQLEKYRGSMVRMDFVAALLHSDSVQILDVMQLLATGAISNTTLGTKDVVFRFGMEALSCYLPVSGSLSYLQESQEHIPCVKWAAEMCLWTEWYYVGDLVADSVSQLLVLDMESFCETLSGSRVTQKLGTTYAREYVTALHIEETWSDLWHLDRQPEVQDLWRGRGQSPELIFNTFQRARTPGRAHSNGGRMGTRLGTFTRAIVPID
ncbi:unnamed protein product [Durusdinium trenchii]|uniref:Uncharacterized protein n=1 Tax=Durusdinium trenchii TaxID=1381693 RepID=A0ABP0HWC8_9DINO